MIAWVIEEEFGTVYHPGHVRKLLHDLGFSVQRPRRMLARADRHQQVESGILKRALHSGTVPPRGLHLG